MNRRTAILISRLEQESRRKLADGGTGIIVPANVIIALCDDLRVSRRQIAELEAQVATLEGANEG